MRTFSRRLSPEETPKELQAEVEHYTKRFRANTAILTFCGMIAGLQLPIQSLFVTHDSAVTCVIMTTLGLVVFFSAGPFAGFLAWTLSRSERRGHSKSTLEEMGFELAKRAGYRLLWGVPVVTESFAQIDSFVAVGLGQLMVSKRAAEEFSEPVIKFGMAYALARSMESFLLRASWFLLGAILADGWVVSRYLRSLPRASWKAEAFLASLIGMYLVFILVASFFWKRRSGTAMSRALQLAADVEAAKTWCERPVPENVPAWTVKGRRKRRAKLIDDLYQAIGE